MKVPESIHVNVRGYHEAPGLSCRAPVPVPMFTPDAFGVAPHKFYIFVYETYEM